MPRGLLPRQPSKSPAMGARWTDPTTESPLSVFFCFSDVRLPELVLELLELPGVRLELARGDLLFRFPGVFAVNLSDRGRRGCGRKRFGARRARFTGGGSLFRGSLFRWSLLRRRLLARRRLLRRFLRRGRAAGGLAGRFLRRPCRFLLLRGLHAL